ncbi:unnamed protein product [Heligmosomoides polygyrus]|uniref:Disintegrin domain-containing protein n=1 Tax=Heligmosomoides polygyrus TaxID=6339 RepID=A0A183FVC8_HELPZ|nr:unnamed protein product [Heligmosomoides polygyrus]
MFDHDDTVLVASGELTPKEMAELGIQAKRDHEGSGEEDFLVPTTEFAIEERADDRECHAFEVCYSDKDCPGGECLGAFVGKCNCNACMDFWLCQSDAACGGLKGACNSLTNTCDCTAGLKAAGFPLFVDALRGLCNSKSCSNENHEQECFGLPCHFGRCNCH